MKRIATSKFFCMYGTGVNKGTTIDIVNVINSSNNEASNIYVIRTEKGFDEISHSCYINNTEEYV